MEGGGGLKGVPDIRSFIHIHAYITSKDIPPVLNATFPSQWAVVQSWDKYGGGGKAPRNIILCSMTYPIDPNLAPSGHHGIHIYVLSTEPYKDW